MRAPRTANVRFQIGRTTNHLRHHARALGVAWVGACALVVCFEAARAAPDAEQIQGPAVEGMETTPIAETRVRIRRRPLAPDIARVDLDTLAGWLSAENQLLALPGLTLLHHAGPLAPVRVAVRGLSGARLAIDLDGLKLNDPVHGLVDIGALPFTAIDAAILEAQGAGSAPGGVLHLRTSARVADAPRLRARLAAGSLDTLRLAIGGDVATAHGMAAVDADAGQSNGAFAYVPVGGHAVLLRSNADERRASARLLLKEDVPGMDATAVQATVLALGHAGGVAGLAASAADGAGAALRAEDALIGGRVAVTHGFTAGEFSTHVDVRATSRASYQRALPRVRSGVDGVTARAGVSIVDVPAMLGMTIAGDVAAGQTAARAFSSGTLGAATFERTEVAGHGAAAADLTSLGVLPAQIDVDTDVLLTTDVGTLFGGRLRATVRPEGSPVALALSASRRARPPTLDELYAPQGYVRANPRLRPEVGDDLELAVAGGLGRVVSARAALFVGALEDAIVYVNRNAYELAPVNTGLVWRSGAEAFVEVRPIPVLALRSTVSGLYTELSATAAPLPGAPALAARTELSLGAASTPRAMVAVRSRSAVTSNLYGTLTAPAQSLVDLGAAFPLSPTLRVEVSIQNAFDVLDARDQHQLPLPGRLMFASLVVSP